MKTHIILISLFLGIVGQINAQNFWTELNTPNSNGAYFIKSNIENTVFLGTNDLYKSTNNGETWDLTNFGLLAGVIEINCQTGELFVGNHIGVFKSEDNGNNWTQTVYNDNAHSIFLCSNNDLVIGFWGGVYLLKENGNNGYITMQIDNDQIVNSFTEDHNNVLYAGITSFMTDAGGVYRSFDYGETWEYAGLSGYYIKTLACDSNGNLYSGSTGNYGIGIYRSQDQGLTWTGLKNDVFVESIVITPDDHVYIGCSNEYGTQGGVFASTDYGDTWEMINTGLNNENVYGLSYAPNGYLYAYGNHLHRSQNPVCSKIETQTNSNQEFMVFPNPVTDYLQIKSQTNPRSTGPVTVKMLDMYGRLVCSENNYISNSRVDVSGLDDGVYLLLIEAENKRFEQRIVKIK